MVRVQSLSTPVLATVNAQCTSLTASGSWMMALPVSPWMGSLPTMMLDWGGKGGRLAPPLGGVVSCCTTTGPGSWPPPTLDSSPVFSWVGWGRPEAMACQSNSSALLILPPVVVVFLVVGGPAPAA